MNYHFLRSNTFAQPDTSSIKSTNNLSNNTAYTTGLTYSTTNPAQAITSSSGSGRANCIVTASATNRAASSSYASPASTQYDRVLSSINPNSHHFMSSSLASKQLQHTAYSNIYDTINSIGYNKSSYLQTDLHKNNAAQLEQALLTPNYNYASRSKSVSLILFKILKFKWIFHRFYFFFVYLFCVRSLLIFEWVELFYWFGFGLFSVSLMLFWFSVFDWFGLSFITRISTGVLKLINGNKLKTIKL